MQGLFSGMNTIPSDGRVIVTWGRDSWSQGHEGGGHLAFAPIAVATPEPSSLAAVPPHYVEASPGVGSQSSFLHSAHEKRGRYEIDSMGSSSVKTPLSVRSSSFFPDYCYYESTASSSCTSSDPMSQPTMKRARSSTYSPPTSIPSTFTSTTGTLVSLDNTSASSSCTSSTIRNIYGSSGHDDVSSGGPSCMARVPLRRQLSSSKIEPYLSSHHHREQPQVTSSSSMDTEDEDVVVVTAATKTTTIVVQQNHHVQRPRSMSF